MNGKVLRGCVIPSTSRSCKESEREDPGEFVRSEYTKPVVPILWPSASGCLWMTSRLGQTHMLCPHQHQLWPRVGPTDRWLCPAPPSPTKPFWPLPLPSCAHFCGLCPLFFCLHCQVLSQIFPGLYSFMASFVVSCLLFSCVLAFAGKT